ncbi:MAG: VCBS repeat-containing protein [bacterium]
MRIIALALLLASVPVLALINPRYTPVDLVKGAQTIVATRIALVAENPEVSVTLVTILKGKQPAALHLLVPVDDELERFRTALGTTPVDATLFLGDFSAAVDNVEDEQKPVGALHVSAAWFGLTRDAEGRLHAGKDPLDLQTVWAGGDIMLQQAVSYVVATPNPYIPANTGTTWSGDTDGGAIAGTLTGATALDALGDGKTCLLLTTTAGNRLFRFTAERKVENITAQDKTTWKPSTTVKADLDNEGKLDVVTPVDGVLLLQRGGETITTHLPSLPGAVTALFASDLDGDGYLDLVVAGAEGALLLHNDGKGGFRIINGDSGEVAYDLKQGITSAGAFDVNGDNRDDLYFGYAGIAPQFFFNRGFACFGLSGDLALREWGVKGTPDTDITFVSGVALSKGQQALAPGDYDGDGAQDMAIIDKVGHLYILWGNPVDMSAFRLTVALPAGSIDPITVIGYEGKRCLGAKLIQPGKPVTFTRDSKGPLRVVWTTANGKKHEKTTVMMKAMRVELSKD